MFNPITTYRIQFNKEFTFQNFDAIIPYLHRLGVKTIYASPIFEAVPGSMHGYDVVNPYHINPEIGSEEELQLLSKKLKKLGIGWIQDIVPNHMAFHHANSWLMDVLEKGILSVYASFFDVSWTNALFRGRIMAPFLDGSVEEIIQRQELRFVYKQERLMIKYFDHVFPLHARTYETVFTCSAEPISDELRLLLKQLEQIYQITDPINYALRWHEFLIQLTSLMSGESRFYIDRCIKTANNDPALIYRICDSQVYRLCNWRETDQRINYRRFFTVNNLICLNMQSKEVFGHYHQKIKSLLEEGIFQGLRVDHIDGLYDPLQYLHRLREMAGDETYIVVEKILAPGEQLPPSWPVQGTTGYDFLGIVNNLFTRNDAEKIFSKFYYSLIHEKRSAHDRIVDQKTYILYHQMGGELENLYQLFVESNLVEADKLEEIRPENLRDAIGHFLIHCPLYRFYGNRFPLSEEEREAMEATIKSARKHRSELNDAFDLLEEVFLPEESKDEEYGARAIHFYQRCMQFTGPLMAKGVEDTLMYTFNRFVGHNEVGDSPAIFGLRTSDFHQKMMERLNHFPLTMNATSTHDTKRGEDVRSRLNVLTDLSDEWMEKVEEWRELNEKYKINNAPDTNDEYFIYQTLTGAIPITEEEDFKPRLEEYLVKALREAKRISSWSSPNEDYEKDTLSFLKNIFNSESSFFKSLRSFQKKVNDHGIINSLSQVVLKFTCPGIPDTYQGAGSWDLSLVDPDNRRPIDYQQRGNWLNELLSASSDKNDLIKELWNTRNDSRIKLWLVHELMQLRFTYSELFSYGLYIPLEVKGKYKEHIVAFARKFDQEWIIVAVPLYTGTLCQQQKREINTINWRDTCIIPPPEAPLELDSILSKQKRKLKGGILVSDIFKEIPIAILYLKEEKINSRSAGVVLSITSLPSSYGIGDLGPAAFHFVDFLRRGRQTYWQLLPLNPVSKESFYSPYSSFSSRAGNILLISPDELAREGLLDKNDLEDYVSLNTGQVNYESVEKNREALLGKAWVTYQQNKTAIQENELNKFIKLESGWLNDFALYVVLRKKHEQRPWYEWPEEFRLRHSEALIEFASQHERELRQEKWYQFIFATQWKKLKLYCKASGVRLFGDLPFYVGYDSADVWSHPEIFSLNENGSMKGVAGVPPDYFNSNGQLWGMPVFCWDVLRGQNYSWWIERIKKNMELYDVLRFDHFRAFESFWEVPAGESNAINGEWKKGPGSDFFRILEEHIGGLPFIAEDLGDIGPAVHALRDELKLYGMKILQYAFDESMASSIFIPHQYTNNFVVYTGTHDNNTTRGWYKEDTGKDDRRRIEQYLGRKVKEKNISEALIRLGYSSVAGIAIITMQDIFNLDESARMNMPSSTEGNWKWRMKADQLTAEVEATLNLWTRTYGR
jgi:malto-oligosyltrehalose synthase/4-alpha-glucanotransferase